MKQYTKEEVKSKGMIANLKKKIRKTYLQWRKLFGS